MNYRYVLLTLVAVVCLQFVAHGEEFQGWYGVEPGATRWDTDYSKLSTLVDSDPKRAVTDAERLYRILKKPGALPRSGDKRYLALLDSVIVAAASKAGNNQAIVNVIARTDPTEKQWYAYVDAVARMGDKSGRGRVSATHIYKALNAHGNVVLHAKHDDVAYEEAMLVAVVAEEQGLTKPVREYLEAGEDRLDKSPLQNQGDEGKRTYYRYKAGYAAARKDFRQAVRYEAEALKLAADDVGGGYFLELQNYLCSLNPHSADAIGRGETVGRWRNRIRRAYAAYKSGSKEAIATALYRDFDDSIVPGKTPDFVSLYVKGLLLEAKGEQAESLSYYRDGLRLYPDFLPALERQAFLASLLLENNAAAIRRVAKKTLEPKFLPVAKAPDKEPKRAKADEVEQEVEEEIEEELTWLEKLDELLKKPEYRKDAKAKAKEETQVQEQSENDAEETQRLERELALAIEKEVEATSKPYRAIVIAYRKCLARYGDTEYARPGKLLVGEYLPGKSSK